MHRSLYRNLMVLLVLMLAFAGTLNAQGRRREERSAIVHVVVNGQVIAQHPALQVSGIKYVVWGLGTPADTAVSDAKGMFHLTLTSKERINLKRGVLIGVQQVGADSVALSLSDDVMIRSDTSVVQVNVFRYPRATVANGDLPKGTFTLPQFRENGDKDALSKFLAKELRYPDDARENGMEGKVLVRFVVDQTGDLITPEIVKTPYATLGKEVLRMLDEMPYWKPGTIDGKATSMYFYLPVTFMLD